jgi:hypothetical protein
VRMLQPCCQRDLALEALDRNLSRHLGGEQLHHDLSPQRSLGGNKDVRHPAAAEFTVEHVGIAEGLLKLDPDVGGQIAVWLGRCVGGKLTCFECGGNTRALESLIGYLIN